MAIVKDCSMLYSLLELSTLFYMWLRIRIKNAGVMSCHFFVRLSRSRSLCFLQASTPCLALSKNCDLVEVWSEEAICDGGVQLSRHSSSRSLR